jgi:GT2 family glycosyltransferase
VIENGENLGFAKANNVAFLASSGEYILILNPDTIVQKGALDEWVRFADQHPEAGGFGCHVLNGDGSYQRTAEPFPTIWRFWIGSLCWHPLAYFVDMFIPYSYSHWKGDTERKIDWQWGCCLMVRGDLLKRLGGFDERFLYWCQDVDLCHRIWDAGHSILYAPQVTITHFGGLPQGRCELWFQLEKTRNLYHYFHKYYGNRGARHFRQISLVYLRARRLEWELLQRVRPTDEGSKRTEIYRICTEWNKRLDPTLFIQEGAEPQVDTLS